MKRFSFVIIILFLLPVFSVYAVEKTLIYKINLKKEVGSTTWRYVKRGMAEASK